jgi:hypothetical protein
LPWLIVADPLFQLHQNRQNSWMLRQTNIRNAS